MPSQLQYGQKLPADEKSADFTPRTSIHWKVLRQLVLLVTFCILLLGGLSFMIIRAFQENLPPDAGEELAQLNLLGGTVLILSGLLFLLALFLGTLLARGLARPLQELSEKVQALRPGTWTFRPTVHTGDEVESLDRFVDDLTQRLRNAYEHLEEKVAERTRQLREESALDRSILESIEYGVLAVDKAGVITDVNPAACSLLQSTREKLIGQRGCDELALLKHEGESTCEENPITQVLKHRTSYHSRPSQHASILRKDKSILPITLLVVPLFQGTNFFGALAVVQDETLERQIDYMKSEFISLASHQLRTPLSSIRWYIEMLSSEEGKFSDEHKSYLREVDVATKRMANLIEALLHVAKLEDGSHVTKKQHIDLSQLFQRFIEGWTTTAKKQEIPFHTDIPETIPGITTDPILLEIILQNLFANALKYSPAKKAITFRVVLDPGHIRMIIQDEGIGIPQLEQKRIFQKFFRAHNARGIDTDGTGLGLYMSKTITENLSGALTFTSVDGKGSEFTLTLPLA